MGGIAELSLGDEALGLSHVGGARCRPALKLPGGWAYLEEELSWDPQALQYSEGWRNPQRI